MSIIIYDCPVGQWDYSSFMNWAYHVCVCVLSTIILAYRIAVMYA